MMEKQQSFIWQDHRTGFANDDRFGNNKLLAQLDGELGLEDLEGILSQH